MRRNWTEEEVEFLKENHETLRIKQIAEKLGRSEDAVRGRAKFQGLIKSKKWTDDEDIYLEYFIYENDAKIQEAAIFLNRTVKAIYTRLVILRKNNNLVCYARKKWTKDEKEYIKKNYLAISVKNMAERLGRTESAVAYQMRQLGVRKIKAIEVFDKKIRKLAAEGYYLRQASRILGISNTSLINYCSRKGITFRKATSEETTAKLKEVLEDDYQIGQVRKRLRKL